MKVCARFFTKQVERQFLNFSENCQIKDYCYLGVSTNSKGLEADILDDEEIKKDLKELDINKGEFYLFYPLKK